MATKTLSIVVRAVDQATAPLRATIGAVASVASKIAGVGTALAGAVGGGVLVQNVLATARALDDINDASTRLGVGVQHLSEMRYVARLSGVSFEELAEGVSTAMKNVSQFATTGGGRAKDALKRLGVDLVDASGKVRESGELVDDLVGKLGQIGNAAERVELAKRIFGNDKFLQFAAEGGERLAVMREEARRLGAAFGPEQVQNAARFRDSVDRVKAAWEGLAARIIDKAGPAVAGFLNKTASVIAAVPSMVGNLADRVYKAVAGDGRALAAFEKLGQDVLTFLVVFVGAAFDVMAHFVVPYAWRFARVVGAEFQKGLLDWASGVGGMAGKVIADMIGKSAIDVALGVDEAFKLTEQDMSYMLAKFAEVKSAAGPVAESLSTIFGFGPELAKTRIDDLVAKQERMASATKSTADATGLWGTFVQGVRDRYGQLVTATESARDVGAQAFGTLAESLSSGFATATVDAIASAKNFGAAIRDVVASSLRQVAALILQFLFLRAIMGALGGLFETNLVGGVGNGVKAASSVSFNPGNFVEAGVPTFDRGGMVPAPYGRPRMIIAHGGERVLNPRETAAYNRGGAGGGVTINQEFNLSGTATEADARMLARAAAAGVREELARNPSFRAEVRSYVGGAA